MKLLFEVAILIEVSFENEYDQQIRLFVETRQYKLQSYNLYP